MLTGSITTLADRSRAVSGDIARDVLGETGTRIVDAARGPWPVDSGKSRAALRARAQLAQGKARLTLEDLSGYAIYIVSDGVRPWELYILRPAMAAGDEIALEFGRRWADAMSVR